jgi:fidgetin-like protein 1
VPANYKPRSETEKALQESLRDMEVQCKERVDLLEALKQSRLEQNPTDEANGVLPSVNNGKLSKAIAKPQGQSSDSGSIEKGWIGNGTIPAVGYSDLSRPPLPPRPPLIAKGSFEYAAAGKHAISSSLFTPSSKYSASNVTLAPSAKKGSRSSSPEKGRSMLTTLRAGRNDKKSSSRSPSISGSSKGERPVPSKAATLAWNSVGRLERDKLGRSLDTEHDNSTTTLNSIRKSSLDGHRSSLGDIHYDSATRRLVDEHPKSASSLDLIGRSSDLYNSAGRGTDYLLPQTVPSPPVSMGDPTLKLSTTNRLADLDPQMQFSDTERVYPKNRILPQPYSPYPGGNFDSVSYPTEYPEASAKKSKPYGQTVLPIRRGLLSGTYTLSDTKSSPSKVARKPVADTLPPRHQDRHMNRDEARRVQRKEARKLNDEDTSSQSLDDETNESEDNVRKPQKKPQKQKESPILAGPTTPTSENSDLATEDTTKRAWKEKFSCLLKNLPKGTDDTAARQILNEVVVKGDEVHWDDVAGLEAAKTALKEAVVYPFLRPDLFMGLREPARGMLLFGPPGTGKTMLARAVATESRSTFFSISASSLTSKYLGESEKLVRALFSLAKSLAPSIIFVDEIDSLLSSRSGSENEATRRIKTEFLIQWSDLQRAAAGREQTDKEKEKGDASRVLVLAATNLPWAIDEAARRRFVRRQYIPLPEGETRATQLRNLLGHQKHSLEEQDIQILVRLTDGNLTLSLTNQIY